MKIIPDSKPKIAIIGLGYVGLPLAVEFGKRRTVVGYDINQQRVDELTKNVDKTLEVTSEDLELSANLSFSSQLSDIADCGIYIITVPTPIDSANRPELTPLRKASELVASVLVKGNIVIYESTVYPGCTEEFCVPVLESVSGLTFNEDFYCGYSPERINPGDKENTLTKIIKITSGSTPEVASIVEQLYLNIITAGTFPASSIKVAEAAKVIENTQRDLNIALVNELSVIFDLLDIDTIDVLEAAGSKWNFLPFRPGMVGGHCIGVDPYYLTHKAEMIGYHPEVILAGRRINDNMAAYVANSLVKRMVANGIDVSQCRVGILGITFKENCPDIRNSKVVDLISELESWGIEVSVTDAWASREEVNLVYGLDLVTIDETSKLDALVVAVGHNEYRELTAKTLIKMVSSLKPVICDVKAIYDRQELSEAGFTVSRL
ncbi:nucleotide sugar dehydrogenase [Pseudomonadales bacterium]|nr:nucleotide sugar dehydrogenase [Pseudomonadales bacterium]